jgi:transposase-like protein
MPRKKRPAYAPGALPEIVKQRWNEKPSALAAELGVSASRIYKLRGELKLGGAAPLTRTAGGAVVVRTGPDAATVRRIDSERNELAAENVRLRAEVAELRDAPSAQHLVRENERLRALLQTAVSDLHIAVQTRHRLAAE